MTRANTLPTTLTSSVVVTVALLALVLVLGICHSATMYHSMILASDMSCGTAPSCQHWQRTLCSASSKVVLQCLTKKQGGYRHCGEKMPTRGGNEKNKKSSHIVELQMTRLTHTKRETRGRTIGSTSTPSSWDTTCSIHS